MLQVSSPANGTPSPRQPPVSPAEEALAPPPKSKGGGPFLLLSAAFCVAAGAGLYYTFYVDPASGHKALAPADPPTSPVSLLEPPKLSAQDEMILKRDMLRAELEHLRSQKRTKYIDAKKREIKDELKDLDGRIRKASA